MSSLLNAYRNLTFDLADTREILRIERQRGDSLIASIEAARAETRRYRDALWYLRNNIDGYDATFACCGVDDLKEEP